MLVNLMNDLTDNDAHWWRPLDKLNRCGRGLTRILQLIKSRPGSR
jgi:hypothetical protein